MAKTGLNRSPKVVNDIKRQNFRDGSERPRKRLKALLEEDDTSGEEKDVSDNATGVPVRNEESEPDGHGFRVNHEFAKRFEHNKKREEFHKREQSFAQSR